MTGLDWHARTVSANQTPHPRGSIFGREVHAPIFRSAKVLEGKRENGLHTMGIATGTEVGSRAGGKPGVQALFGHLANRATGDRQQAVGELRTKLGGYVGGVRHRIFVSQESETDIETDGRPATGRSPPRKRKRESRLRLPPARKVLGRPEARLATAAVGKLIGAASPSKAKGGAWARWRDRQVCGSIHPSGIAAAPPRPGGDQPP